MYNVYQSSSPPPPPPPPLLHLLPSSPSSPSSSPPPLPPTTPLPLPLLYSLVNSSVRLVNTTTSSIQLLRLSQGSYTAYVVTIGELSNTTSTSGPSQTVQFYVEPGLCACRVCGCGFVSQLLFLLPLPLPSPSPAMVWSAIINGVISVAIILVVLIAILTMCLGAFLYMRR